MTGEFSGEVKEENYTPRQESLGSRRDSFYDANTWRTRFRSTRPGCKYHPALVAASYSTFGANPSYVGEMGMLGGYEDSVGTMTAVPSRL